MKRLHKGIFVTVILTLLLSGCGYHLRGHHPDGEFVLKQLNIKGASRYDDIAANVRQLATAHNIELTNKAEWSILLGAEEMENWQASTPQSLTTIEYYIRLKVELTIQNKDITYNPIMLMEETIFQDNANVSSSKNNERDLIIGELRRKLAQDVLRRVEHIAANPPDCDCDEPEPNPTR